VLGRLPAKYRLTIWVAGLLTFSGVGAWIGLTTGLPLVWSSGVLIGAGLGALVVAGYLHLLERDPVRRPGDPKPSL
jgi:hypothetical protein